MLASDRTSLLLNDFNEYRSRTQYLSQFSASRPMVAGFGKKALPYLAEMDSWCATRGIDSRRWLYWLFQRTNFRYSPKLAYLVPRPKKEVETLEKFRRLRDTPYLAQRLHRDFNREKVLSGVAFDANRDLSAMAESLKRRYLGQGDPQRCLDEMFINAPDTHATWGYHPKSLACARCPLQEPCKAKLRSVVYGFDPVALRAGEITLEQAQIAEGRWHHASR